MTKNQWRVWRYLQAVLRHGLSLVGSAVVALVTLVMGWVGPSWWMRPQLLFYVALIGAGLIIAQYLAWSEQWEKNRGLKQKLRGRFDQERRMALAAMFDMKFGPSSNVVAFDRFGLMAECFQELEAKVVSGDYSKAVEVLALKDVMLQVLRGHFAGGAGYSDWADRLFLLVESIHQHYGLQAEELDRDED